MESTVSSFLTSLGTIAFRLSALIFLIVNCAAIAVFATTRSRQLVNTWTARLVTLDVILLGAGLGVPLLGGLAKLGVHAVAALFGSAPPAAR